MQEPQSFINPTSQLRNERTTDTEDYSPENFTQYLANDSTSVLQDEVDNPSPQSPAAQVLPTPPNGGGVVYPILWSQLVPKIGFGWATRVIGFIMMATLILPLIVMRPLQYPKTRRSLFDVSSLKDVPYVFFGFGILFGYMGIYVVFFYIQLYAMDRAGVSSYLAFYLPALINAGSSLGRILPNFAADYVGTLNMQMIFAFASAVLSLSLIAIRNVQGILAFSILYGFFTGTFVSLPAPTVASLSPDVASLGGRMSMAFMAAGIGSLIGSPIAGAILSTNGGKNWDILQVWSGVLLVLSALSMLGARTAKVGTKLKAKA
ncbi:hypothetical protein MaudCBS49596_005861 [Microsporum audouinii]